MLSRSVKGLLNPRQSTATIKLDAKTDLIPHLKKKFHVDLHNALCESALDVDVTSGKNLLRSMVGMSGRLDPMSDTMSRLGRFRHRPVVLNSFG